MRLIGAGVMALLSVPALGWAADARGPASAPRATGYTVSLGAEARYMPRWDGSADMRWVPVPLVDIRPAGTPHRFSAPRDGLGFGLIDAGEFRVGPVGKLRVPRKASDHPKLAGLGDVDWALELGVFAEYWVQPWLRARAELRQGLGGHRGLVGDLTMDAVWRATSQLTLSGGPRISFGSAAALRPYFGIDPAQSLASGLPVHDARGGVQSYGAGAQARYAWNPQWATHVFVEYERLAGSAADSPLVAQRGSRDQWTFGTGLTYTFDFNW